MAHSSLRFGIGRFTTEAEVDFVIDKIVAVVQKLRDMRCVHRSTSRYVPCAHLALLQPAVGDGPGGHRHQHNRLVSTLVCFLISSPIGGSWLFDGRWSMLGGVSFSLCYRQMP